MGLTASVLGASGYAGGELVRLLEGHPALAVVALGARSRAGEDAGVVHPHLRGAGAGSFSTLRAAAGATVDVCFSCLPSGAIAEVADDIDAGVIVDLSDDHRAAAGWVYGLTEHARADVAGATRIANPGCYPTASLLGLIPFVRAGVIEGPVIVDALSGVSGAGKGLDESRSFSALYGSATAYGSVSHRHRPEIERGLAAFGGRGSKVTFTPHLVPMARGLLVTVRAACDGDLDDAVARGILEDSYGTEDFVTVTEEWPSTKAVAGSNHALVSARVDRHVGMLVVSVAIDNLGKGAAGQALQNANLALGLDETSGLTSTGVWP